MRSADRSNSTGPLWVLGALAGTAAFAAARHFRPRRAMFDPAGSTVLISGGARGLGYLLAREFGRLGARVVIFSRTPDELSRAEAKLRAEGVDVESLRCDVRNPDEVSRLVADVAGRTGGLDIIVNNAGIIQATPFEHTRLEDFDESLKTHFWGALYLIRESLPHLRQRGGRILNVASIGGRLGVPHLAPYCSGKFALVGLSETLHAELAKDGVHVTTVTPGLMRTGSHLRVLLRGQHEREARWFGLGITTPLTSMSADRAARKIVRACLEGRAHVTPGIQARLAEILNVAAPGLTAGIAAAVTALLPGPSGSAAGDSTRVGREVGFGWLNLLLPNRAARRNNEVPLALVP